MEAGDRRSSTEQRHDYVTGSVTARGCVSGGAAPPLSVRGATPPYELTTICQRHMMEVEVEHGTQEDSNGVITYVDDEY